MEVIVGKYSGFCAGVNYTYQRAVEEVKKGPTYCLGEIIHNKQVVEELENLGMVTIDDISFIPIGSRVIFRAHGESEKIYNLASKMNHYVIDLTCGRVKAIHIKVAKEKENSFIIIIGKKTHPEIIGTLGFAGDNSYVIENDEDIEEAYKKYLGSNLDNVYIVSQTTFSSSSFDSIVNKIKEVFKNISIVVDKTICDATEKRQKEVEEISKKCTVMLVIGSENSSNTRELYNIASKNCRNVYFVTDEESVTSLSFDDNDVVGVVAGASAPKYLIESIVNIINHSNYDIKKNE